MAVKSDVKLKTLSYIMVYTKDTKKSLPFYRDTLGMKLRVEDEGWVEFDTGSVTFALHQSDELKTAPVLAPVPVFEVENIQEAYESLKAKGVKFECEPHVVCEAEGKLGKCAEFKDPDGNQLSIFGYTTK